MLGPSLEDSEASAGAPHKRVEDGYDAHLALDTHLAKLNGKASLAPPQRRRKAKPSLALVVRPLGEATQGMVAKIAPS